MTEDIDPQDRPVPIKEVWRCDKCLLVQFATDDPRCRRCKHHRSSVAQTTEVPGQERTEDSGLVAIQRELAEQGKALERVERRIRQLEVDSVQRLQGIPRERREPEELVN